MEIMKLWISESMEYDSADESPGDPLGFRISDIESDYRPENSEPLPGLPGERAIRTAPFQYKRFAPDRDVLDKTTCKKWTEEREVCIGAWDEVAGLFSDVLAVRVIRESTGYVHEEPSPNEPESARKGGVPENYLKRIKRTFGEVKDLFRVFGSQSWSARKTCPNRNA
jgi:hypothetical protein